MIVKEELGSIRISLIAVRNTMEKMK